eukprot:gene15223-18007_t
MGDALYPHRLETGAAEEVFCLHEHKEGTGDVLCLRDQQLTAAPALQTTLTRLDLSRNHLGDLGGALLGLSRLRSLCLDRNRLKSLDGILPVAAAATLTSLSLCAAVTGSRPRQLPEELFALTSLTALDVRFLCLRELQPRVSALSRLQSLALAGNRLRALPLAALGSLPELRLLDLSRNRLPAEDIRRSKQVLTAGRPQLRVVEDVEDEATGGAEEREPGRWWSMEGDAGDWGSSESAECGAPVPHPRLLPGQHPSLRLQLSVLSTPTLRDRLRSLFGRDFPPGAGARHRHHLLMQVCKGYEENGWQPRREVHVSGVRLPPRVVADLRQELEATAWPRPRERSSVTAGEYLTLTRPGSGASKKAKAATAKTMRHLRLW